MKVHSPASKKLLLVFSAMTITFSSAAQAQLIDKETRKAKREEELKVHQERFSWWPSDAKPAPVKDEKGGFWWWPNEAGTKKELWGNRGYVYVYKFIYDYKNEEDTQPPATPTPELKPSLLIKKIIRNVKIYFDYNKALLRDDHAPLLNKAVKTLERNKDASILITGNCDARGSDEYNQKLGLKRGEAVKKYMLDHGITEDRIKIISRGKLDAVAPVKDIVGMQKDRNAQFMVAEVDEIMMAAGETPQNPEAQQTDKGKYILEQKENLESAPKASTREYTIQANDSLWKIAQNEMGNGKRWQYLYELNKDRIQNPNKLKKGTVIIIPVE
jgi:outer membrane protein OmpA-like peptidoglycan-associated protein